MKLPRCATAPMRVWQAGAEAGRLSGHGFARHCANAPTSKGWVFHVPVPQRDQDKRTQGGLCVKSFACGCYALDGRLESVNLPHCKI
jgi:hypothetical protein